MKYLIGTLCAASVAVLTVVLWLSIGLSARVAELKADNQMLRHSFAITLAKYTEVLDAIERRQTRVENVLWDSQAIVESSKIVEAYNSFSRPRVHYTLKKRSRRRGRGGR